MPELPEVETIKRGLQKTIVGKKVIGVKVLRKKSFQGSPKEIIGKTITSISRRAKLLIIELSSDLILVIHLKLTGQLIYKCKVQSVKCKVAVQNSKLTKVEDLNKYTRVIIEFKDGNKLLFNDLRVFGWMKVITSKKLRIMNQELGIEPFSKEFTVDYLKGIFSKTKRAIKIVLMDQKKIAGIGNIYANEALWEAGINPRTPANKLVPVGFQPSGISRPGQRLPGLTPRRDNVTI